MITNIALSPASDAPRTRSSHDGLEIELIAAAKEISAWGIASLVLLLGGRRFGEYNLYLYDHTGRPWISFAVANQICVVVLLAAVVCGVIAMRRGSKWWALTVAPALLFAIIYYFGDL